MNYQFYGKNIISTFTPVKTRNPFDYSIAEYNVNENREVSWEKFYEKTLHEKELTVGEKIEISNETLIIQDIRYDIENECYKIYTNKVLSQTTNGMSREEAEKKLAFTKQFDKTFIGRLKELKFQF